MEERGNQLHPRPKGGQYPCKQQPYSPLWEHGDPRFIPTCLFFHNSSLTRQLKLQALVGKLIQDPVTSSFFFTTPNQHSALPFAPDSASCKQCPPWCRLRAHILASLVVFLFLPTPSQVIALLPVSRVACWIDKYGNRQRL